MTPRESHATCVTCAASYPNGPVSVRTGPVWTDNSASACQRGTTRSFLVRKRVCNTICSLNGARQRVRGWSCITTATVLQETTVCVSPLNFLWLFCASHVWWFLHHLRLVPALFYRTTIKWGLHQTLASAFHLVWRPENPAAFCRWLH